MEIDTIFILEQTIANGIVAVTIGMLLPYWWQRFSRPQSVKIHERDSGNETIPYSVDEDETARSFSAELVLHNSGNVSLEKTVYYFLLIPAHIDYTLHPLNDHTVEEKRLGRFTYIRGKIYDVVYPQRYLPLPFILNGEIPRQKTDRDKIYYWLSTEHGIFPKGARDIEERDIPALDHEDLNHLGVLAITNER